MGLAALSVKANRGKEAEDAESCRLIFPQYQPHSTLQPSAGSVVPDMGTVHTLSW